MEEEIEQNESNEDFGNTILSEFGNSTNESHQLLCRIIGTISKVIKRHNVPSSPVVYFAYTISSLKIIYCKTDPDDNNLLFNVLITILSLVIVKVPVDTLLKTREILSELVATVIVLPSISESSVVDGLKCLEHLFIIGGDSLNCVLPSDDSPLFNVLSRFLTDSRPDVRRQCRLCLRSILINFQNSPLLASASESVINLLERVPLIAGGANANADEGTKGAQQVLYILDALKECLPLLSLNYKKNILKHFKCKCW